MKVLALILLLGAVVAPIASTSCPDGWMPYGGKCYYFRRTAQSWTAARSWCQGQGGDLARPDTSSRNSFITYLTYGMENVWIGLSDGANEGHFHWLGTNQHAEYTPWKSGQPDNHNGREDCAMTNFRGGGYWNDANCGSAYRFVCERYASSC